MPTRRRTTAASQFGAGVVTLVLCGIGVAVTVTSHDRRYLLAVVVLGALTVLRIGYAVRLRLADGSWTAPSDRP
ncbi:hypothetical protein [Actinocatenispora rupis]|uniref:hypothetical protein n=1 Tax=Actinocatenispora rupis TaxID=519421 RepID=UPI001944C489|nr:hypothetical protein [Actinocatenispora rupis]